jgi:hypothetical protein
MSESLIPNDMRWDDAGQDKDNFRFVDGNRAPLSYIDLDPFYVYTWEDTATYVLLLNVRIDAMVATKKLINDLIDQGVLSEEDEDFDIAPLRLRK